MHRLLLLAVLLSGCVSLEEPPETASSMPPLYEPQHLYYEPVQCHGNPWQDAKDPKPEKNDAEAQRIRDYYAARDVTLHDIRFEDKHQGVCAACSCPRGDWIHATVPVEDVGRAKQLGWKSIHDQPSTTLAI